MKNDKPSESGVIAIFVPGLPDTPGWLKLSRKKQDALLEHTSHIQQNRKLQMYGELGEMMELYQVEQLLEGEEMKLQHYFRAIYKDRHLRTAQRKHEWYKSFVAIAPPGVLKRMATVIANHQEGLERITNAALGDLRNAMKELQQLPASTEKDAEKYLEALDTKLLEHRQMKRKGKKLLQDEQLAAKMTTNAAIHYMRACGLKTTSQKTRWLQRSVGWVMEAEAVSGTMRCHRIPIPDGVIIRRGRPRKKPPKAVKEGV